MSVLHNKKKWSWIPAGGRAALPTAISNVHWWFPRFTLQGRLGWAPACPDLQTSAARGSCCLGRGMGEAGKRAWKRGCPPVLPPV